MKEKEFDWGKYIDTYIYAYIAKKI